MKKACLIGIFLAATSCLSIGAEGNSPLDGSIALSLREHRGLAKVPERRAVAQQISQFRAALRLSLKDLIQDDDGVDEVFGPQRLGVELAGEYRIADGELIDYLVENVTKTFVGPRMNITAFETYPCAGALASIGMPSVHGILRLCRKRSISSDEAQLFAAVVEAVDGAKVGGYRLSTEAASATGVYSANLVQILSVLAP